MLHGSIIFIMIVIGLSAFALSSYLLFQRGWFWVWLKASFGISLIGLTLVSCLILFDLVSYKNLMREVPLATISIFEKGEQYFDLTLVGVDGEEQRFDIFGDQWQLDARLLSWAGPWAAMGNPPLYRLDRISGRYVSLEQARSDRQSIYQLEPSLYLDIWQLLQVIPLWIDAKYVSAVYMPMENGAVYAIYLTSKGINVRPINDVAKRLLKTSG